MMRSRERRIARKSSISVASLISSSPISSRPKSCQAGKTQLENGAGLNVSDRR
jgi:hypothetical protein